MPPRAGLITNEPLSGGQSDLDLFQKFKLFMEWDRSTNPPSSALPSLSSASTFFIIFFNSFFNFFF